LLKKADDRGLGMLLVQANEAALAGTYGEELVGPLLELRAWEIYFAADWSVVTAGIWQ
jgi:hypothetical protein